jgi:hypothetical protein
MSSTSLADDLAEIRAEIQRLRRREAELRQALIAAPAAQRQGRWAEAEVTLRKRLVFNPYLLPAEVRQDPRYWEDRASHIVTLRPLGCQPKPRPGWPIRRDGPGVALH